MGWFDRFKNHKTDEDDAIALGVATGTAPTVWQDDDQDGEDEHGDDEAEADR